MIHVVAVITAKPGQRDRILEAFRANRPAVLAEQGCIEYAATVDAAGMPPSRGSFGDDTFVVIEK
ncbi:putative quinol monooxygenase [Variovorax sp. MHTC-1]|uniref:putative quinol monooxygenase n=1 Tax=Variovorax sp. MHTC-1 TaxID=2495593 RepID=UPI0021AF6963|nr:antibiotic biosynthesis monooxygenase family protein [Variovorax sp. MHTC-1]